MTDLKLVIFDMDGLMFDTEQVSFFTLKNACADFGYNLSKEIFYDLLGVNIVRAKKILCDEFGEKFPFDIIIQQKINLAKLYFEQNGVPIKPGLNELLDFLLQNNIARAVATSSNRTIAEDLLQKANIYNKINTIICGDEITNSKPHPEIFLKAIEKMQTTPQNSLVLEDSPMGIQAAHNANIKAIMIPDMIKPNDSTKALYFKEMPSLHHVKIYLSNELTIY